MVLTTLESTQRRCWNAGTPLNKPFADLYQQQHSHEVLQRHHRIYNDLNLLPVNVVKPQPPIEPTRVSHISSNGYYGFVQIHQGNEITAENEASMDCSEEVPNCKSRKRGFENEQPQFVEQMMNAAKKCRLNYEGT